MIVYNVGRSWFTEKVPAEAYRKAQGLRPAATVKIAVGSREDLAALLNALCEPPLPSSAPVGVRLAERIVRDALIPKEVIDRAYVDPNIEVPDFVPLFLINDPEQRKRVKADRESRGWTFEMSERASDADIARRRRDQHDQHDQ